VRLPDLSVVLAAAARLALAETVKHPRPSAVPVHRLRGLHTRVAAAADPADRWHPRAGPVVVVPEERLLHKLAATEPQTPAAAVVAREALAVLAISRAATAAAAS
jgi:hypothetical protein